MSTDSNDQPMDEDAQSNLDDGLNPDADCFKPPAIPILVHCIHCHQEYESYLMQWRVERDMQGNPAGFWCCGMPGCDGKGFGFDIFPVDPDYVDENGEKMWIDDDEPMDGDLADDDEDEDDIPW
ncbi:MAG: hypothetical protein ACF8OB_09855 [Phycisphaeraceae bacterium JB051]